MLWVLIRSTSAHLKHHAEVPLKSTQNMFSKNICCRYSLEVPCRGASDEYPQHMFSWSNKKNIYLIPTLI